MIQKDRRKQETDIEKLDKKILNELVDMMYIIDKNNIKIDSKDM